MSGPSRERERGERQPDNSSSHGQHGRPSQHDQQANDNNNNTTARGEYSSSFRHAEGLGLGRRHPAQRPRVAIRPRSGTAAHEDPSGSQATSTSSNFTPTSPTTRRRLSVSVNQANTNTNGRANGNGDGHGHGDQARARKKSSLPVDQSMSPRTRPPPPLLKHSKSDDEDDTSSFTPRPFWSIATSAGPSQSHLPLQPQVQSVQAHLQDSPNSFLLPLPSDPHNLLPLSLPSTPNQSPPLSRNNSARPSLADIHDAATASPRTSISTSSSRFGWGRSDSHSSDEEPLWAVKQPRVIHPTPKLFPARNVRRFLGSWRSRKLGRVRLKKDTERTALARLWAFVPTRPSSIIAFLLFALFFTFFVTLSLMHILNPDKRPLPWRQYCSGETPTLYSLQDPSKPHHVTGSASASASHDRATWSNPPTNSIWPINSFAPSAPQLALLPLNSSHAAWPYPSDAAPPLSEARDIPPVGILLGVFSTDRAVERRHMIRQSYARHWRSRRPGTEGVKVQFVLGRPRKEKALQLEMEAFGDIILLDMPENMNSGKTHAFFSWAAENASVYPGQRPDYVVKADDDSFIMLGELEHRLRLAPRQKSIWGYLVKDSFMAGEAYALSFDLVQYVAASPALRTMVHGKEDKLVARWLRMHPQREEIVWVAERCWIYDHPKAGTVYSHGFLYPSTVEAIRHERAAGKGDLATALGGSLADAYSTVSRFGSTFSKYASWYRAPAPGLNVRERVEALVENSPMSMVHRPDLWNPAEISVRRRIAAAWAARSSREEKYLGNEEERGGTVVVHYIKKQEWFVETMVALLGGNDEQDEAKEAERFGAEARARARAHGGAGGVSGVGGVGLSKGTVDL